MIDSKRSSPSLLARQLRLRLVADADSDVPRNLHNIVVSIHAIATFQALHDYLRPRVAGLLSGSSRLSSMFAALAASGFMGAGARLPEESASAPPKPSSSTPANPSSNGGASASAPLPSRRRSQRLSDKRAATSGSSSSESLPDTAGQAAPTSGQTEQPGAIDPSSAIPRLFEPDFSDDEDEIDAEVFNDELDPDASISDKTITVAVAEGMRYSLRSTLNSHSQIESGQMEAQTPEGTRVATPGGAREGPSSKTPTPSRTSYAAALKAKPTDWHLEFSMDDHILPLDLTIYGAIHQHEMRKKTGATPLHMIWQGVYTIKFRKVAGPVSSEGKLNALDKVYFLISTQDVAMNLSPNHLDHPLQH